MLHINSANIKEGMPGKLGELIKFKIVTRDHENLSA